MKNVLKFLLTVLVYCVFFIVMNMVLPFSRAFSDANANTDLSSMVFLFVSCFYNCLVICYLAVNSNWRGIKRSLGIIFSVFMIAAFMTQLETYFFGDAFPILTKTDILFITLAMLPSIIAATWMSVIFFGNKEYALRSEPVPLSPLITRIVSLGLIYAAIYFLFGYFVAWQVEELRLFYSGSTEDAGFFGQLINNLSGNPIIYPFQFVRGILFVSFLLPVFFMLRDSRIKFLLACCLVQLTTAVVLLIPNVLFPDAVRWAHFYEMASSMLLFGMLTGVILYIPVKRDRFL